MKDFKQYCKSYSGIDGGDIHAKYWFVGIEWSNHNDTEYRNKEWNPPKNITGITIEDSDDWNFEKRLEKIYQNLDGTKGKTIFSANSNSLKLNLLPLPFKNFDEHADFKRIYYDKTGFKTYKEYLNGILSLRENLFSELLKKGTEKKIVFCFGLSCRDEFKSVFKIKEPNKRVIKNTYGVEVYIPENKNIEKVFILPFYFAYKDVDKILKELR